MPVKKIPKVEDKTKLFLLSLLLAFALWSSVSAGSVPIRVSRDMEVLALNAQSSWYYQITPSVVKVTYQVPLLGEKPEPLVYVRLDQAKWGDQQLTVESVAPSGGRVISITPQKVMVHVEPVVSKLMPVSAIGMKVEPGQVIVTGPETAVARVVVVRVQAPEQAYGVVQVKALPVDSAGAEVNEVKVNPELLTVTIQQAKDTLIVEVPVVPTLDVPDGLVLRSYSLTPKTVLLEGSSNTLSGVSYVKTVSVRVGEGVKTVDVPLLLPSGVSVREPNGLTVKITYNAEKMVNKDVVIDDTHYWFSCPESVSLTATTVYMDGNSLVYPRECIYLGKGGTR